MTIQFTDATTVKYFLVKEVDGVEVRRTEVRPTDHDKITGRFCERADGLSRGRGGITRNVRCPKCGHRFEMEIN